MNPLLSKVLWLCSTYYNVKWFSLWYHTSKSVYVHHSVPCWETNHKGNSTVLNVEGWSSVKEQLNIVLFSLKGELMMSFGSWHVFSNFKPRPLHGCYLPWCALEIIVTDQISLCCKGCLSLQPFKYCMFPSAAAWIRLSPHVNAAVLYSFSFFIPASILQDVPLWSRFSAVWNLRLKSICSCPPPST